MDRNSFIGLLIIAALIIGYSIYTRPTKEEVLKYRHQQDSVALAKKLSAQTPSSAKNSTSPADTAQLKSKLGNFATALAGKEEVFTMENENIKVFISSKGGKVQNVWLKKYKTYNGKPLMLFKEAPEFGLNLPVDNHNVNTNDLFFAAAGKSFVVSGNGTDQISLRLQTDSSRFIEYLYSLKGDSYDVGFKINIKGFNDKIASNAQSIALNWKATIPRQEKYIVAERNASTIYFNNSEKGVDYLSETSDKRDTATAKVKWVSFKQQYFTAVLIADGSFNKQLLETKADRESVADVKTLSASLALPYQHKPEESIGMRFYFGPNNYKLLKKYDLELEKQIQLGWGIFGWVNRFIVINIFHWLDGFNLNYGLVILILTLAIKLLLTPFTYKAYLSQAKMKVLKPEIEEIQAKKGDDPMKNQQELMALYKKAGVSPFGGCLPMVLQMPILFAMFRFFPASIELRQQSFLWAKDLSTYDSVWDLGFNIPGYGDHVSLFTLLMTISTLIYTRMNSQFTPANAQMKWMSYLMPIIFLGVFNNYAAGLSYYYFLANILTFGQQYLFRLAIDEKAIHEQIQENKKRPASLTKSKFQLKLEEMAKAKGNYKPKK